MNGNKAIVFDLDGTVFDDRWRLGLVLNRGRAEYHQQAGNDMPNPAMALRVKEAVKLGYSIIFLSGRPDKLRNLTQHALVTHFDIRPGQYRLILRNYDTKVDATSSWKARHLSDLIEAFDLVSFYDNDVRNVVAARNEGVPSHHYYRDNDVEIISIDPDMTGEALGLFEGDPARIAVGSDHSAFLSAENHAAMIEAERNSGSSASYEGYASSVAEANSKTFEKAESGPSDAPQGVAATEPEKAEEGPVQAAQTAPAIQPVLPNIVTSFEELPDSSKILLIDLATVADESWRAGAVARDKTNPDYYPNVVNDRVFPAVVPLIAEAIRRGIYLVFSTDRPNEHVQWTVKWLSEKFQGYGDAQFSVVAQNEGGPTGIDARIASLYAVVSKANAAGMRVLASIDSSPEVRDAALNIGLFALRSNGRETFPGPLGGLAMGPQDIVGYILPPKGEPMEGNQELESSSRPESVYQGNWPVEQAEEEIIGDPLEGGASENDGLSPSQIAIIDNLEGAARTFRERAKVYGENDEAIAEIMEILFPNGATLRRADDFRMFHFINHVVGKLTRFAGSGMKDRDSIHDLITYAAFCERECEFHEIGTVQE